MLTCIVLTKNEEKNLERCLASASFCDETIVIDDYSSDKTLVIAKEHKALIFERHLNGNYAEQRNYGMGKAEGDWLLFIDADEEISSELKHEIQKVVKKQDSAAAYYLRRRDYWLGKELQHGEVSKVYHKGLIRLVKKGSGSWKGEVHEKFITSDNTAQLKGFINHFPHQTIKDFILSVNEQSSLRAQELFKQKYKAGIFETVINPLGKFILTYFLKLGFMDGPEGFIYSFMMSFHSFLVRAKLYQYYLAGGFPNRN